MFEIQGIEQHYKWGGQYFIPSLTGRSPEPGIPVAELWFGDHCNGVATLNDGKPLDQWLSEDRSKRLGAQCMAKFGKRLPFLLKVLDVHEPLSIQVHPSLQQARQGFAAEQLNPPEPGKRNYTDPNHKPELMLALSDFWLLHGFRQPSEIRQELLEHNSLHNLVMILEQEGIRGLVEDLFQRSESELARLLLPLIENYQIAYQRQQLSKKSPYFWLIKAYERSQISGQPLEAGLLMILLLNLVYCPKGTALYQGEGVLHSYLEGQCLELMANSDNVLRAGLTCKHVDIAELLRVASFTPVDVRPVQTTEMAGGVGYPVPVDDFKLTAYQLSAGDRLILPREKSPCLWFALSGQMWVTAEDRFWEGGKSAMYQLPDTSETLVAQTEMTLFRAAAKIEL